MNWDIVEGNWRQFRGEVKAQWSKLTDDHLDAIAGKRIELAGKLQEAYGITKDEAEIRSKVSNYATRTTIPSMPHEPRARQGQLSAGASLKGPAFMMRYERFVRSHAPLPFDGLWLAREFAHETASPVNPGAVVSRMTGEAVPPAVSTPRL